MILFQTAGFAEPCGDSEESAEAIEPSAHCWQWSVCKHRGPPQEESFYQFRPVFPFYGRGNSRWEIVSLPTNVSNSRISHNQNYRLSHFTLLDPFFESPFTLHAFFCQLTLLIIINVQTCCISSHLHLSCGENVCLFPSCESNFSV